MLEDKYLIKNTKTHVSAQQGEATVKINKRQLRQIIRESINESWEDKEYEAELTAEEEARQREIEEREDYERGYSDGTIATKREPLASDAYLDGYADGIAEFEASYDFMIEANELNSDLVIALVFRPNYAKNQRVVRIEMNKYAAEVTQSLGSVEARYEATIEDIADMIAKNYPDENIRLDAAAKKANEAYKLVQALKKRGVRAF